MTVCPHSPNTYLTPCASSNRTTASAPLTVRFCSTPISPIVFVLGCACAEALAQRLVVEGADHQREALVHDGQARVERELGDGFGELGFGDADPSRASHMAIRVFVAFEREQ